MSTLFTVLVLLIISLYLVFVLYLLKKKRLYLKYALLWLFTGILMIALTLFPQILGWFFDLLGFEVYSNGLFSILIFFILLMLLVLTSIVSALNEKNRRLVQTVALLEKRIRDLESKVEE